MTAELPGIDPENIDVTIEADVLTIRGEKTEERETTEENRFLHERSYGSFQRRIPLPDGVSPEDMTATYDKGVLTVRVHLPTETKTQPRHIPVEVKS